MGRRRASLSGAIRFRKAGRWSVLGSLIQDGMLVPIISNSVVNDPVFDIDAEKGLGICPARAGEPVDRESEDYSIRINQHLAREWAQAVGYPLAEEPLLLSRVAQYCQVEDSRSLAKQEYLLFLKLHLLELAEEDPQAAEVAGLLLEPFWDSTTEDYRELPQLIAQSAKQSFSEIVFQLGYPKRQSKPQDPLHILAQLPLPVFVTTSHHDFLERALTEKGKHPRMLVCDWFGNSEPLQHRIEWFGDPPDPQEDLDSEATDARPVVCHLYGLESHPETIVVSEDDYMQFLVRVSEDRRNIPLKLRAAVGGPRSAMLLLGYTLRGWDFRVLFRGLIQPYVRARETDAGSNLAVQLNPPCHRRSEDEEDKQEALRKAQQYLETYLDSSNFQVTWKTTTDFLRKLLAEWGRMQQ